MANGERTIRVKFDGSSAGLVAAAAAAKAEIKSLGDDAKKRSASLKEFSSSVGNVAGNLTSMAMSAANIGTVLNVIPALASGVMTLAGVAPLAVAGMFSLVGVMATVKLGADGIKKAFEPLKPQIDSLKSAVSSSFESSLTPAVKNLQSFLPKTKTGFQEIATAIGGVAVRVTDYLKSAKGSSEVNTILDGTSRIIQNLGKFFAPVIGAFLQIGAVAMPILVKLTGGLGAAGQRFADFISHAADTGALAKWIQGAVDAIGRIVGVIKSVAGFVAQVFGDMVQSGQNAGNVLGSVFSLIGLKLGGIPGLIIGTVIPALTAFAKTPMGQQTLRDLATAFQTVSTVVSTVLTRAFQVLAPLIDPLAKMFAGVAQNVGSVLLPVLNFLAPVIQNIANFISQNLSWITPLVTAIALWTAAQWLLNIALDANPIGLVIIAIGLLIAIVATIITYWTPISDFFVWLWGVVTDAVTVAAQWIWQRLVDAWNFIKGVWSGVTGWFSGVWSGITDGVSSAMDWVGNRFSDAWGFIKGVWSSVGSFFSGIWSGIGNGLKSALNGVISLVNGAINGLNRVTGVVGIPGIPNIPYLARGGTARGGRPYIVGEKGPELFVPGQTGRVVSNAQSFGGGTDLTLNLNLGEGIRQVVQVHIDKNNRATWRTVKAGGRA